MKNFIRSALTEIIELPISGNNHTAVARALVETLDSNVFAGMAEANPDDLPPTLFHAQKFLYALEAQVNKAILPALRIYDFEKPESVMGLGYKDIIMNIACMQAKVAAIQKVYDVTLE